MDNKNLISFISGTAIGAIGCWFAVKTYYKNKCEEEIASEIDKIRQYDMEKMDDDISKEWEVVDGSLGLKIIGEGVSSNGYSRVTAELVKTEVNGDDPADNEHPEDDESEPDYEEIIEKLNYNKFSTKVKEKKTELNPEPYIISIDEYGDKPSHMRVMVSYFADDEVLIDSQTDEVIEDIAKTVGYLNLEAMDPDIGELYIRNDLLGIDYQVVLENGSYSSYISGTEEY